MTVGSDESQAIDSVVERCRGAFSRAFGRPPAFAAAAPGRVNLIGEHTDYNGGLVLPIAIDRFCVVVGGPAADPSHSRVHAADLSESLIVDLRVPLTAAEDVPGLVEHRRVRRGSWASYVLGVCSLMRALATHAGRAPLNLDLAISSSVPFGSGLSSSASLEVAVATLLESAWQLSMTPREKAGLCRRAEHEFAGVPCGIMDQYISAMGRENCALLIDCRTETAEAVPMPPPDQAVVIVMNTNVHHALASGEYARRRQECRDAAAKLGVFELRDATRERIQAPNGALSDVELRRARHVVSENARVLDAAEALRHGDLALFGQRMNESHDSLRDEYEVSCDELDLLVEVASGVRGVYGARMTGGGFGGCAIAVAQPRAAAKLSSAAADGYRARFGRECQIFATRASTGAVELAIN